MYRSVLVDKQAVNISVTLLCEDQNTRVFKNVKILHKWWGIADEKDTDSKPVMCLKVIDLDDNTESDILVNTISGWKGLDMDNQDGLDLEPVRDLLFFVRAMQIV